jgi:hypothetical protein
MACSSFASVKIWLMAVASCSVIVSVADQIETASS